MQINTENTSSGAPEETSTDSPPRGGCATAYPFVFEVTPNVLFMSKKGAEMIA